MIIHLKPEVKPEEADEIRKKLTREGHRCTTRALAADRIMVHDFQELEKPDATKILTWSGVREVSLTEQSVPASIAFQMQMV